MNALPVILLAIAALASGELLASVCKNPSGQYITANINDCSKFFLCLGHNATEVSCVNAKSFDSKLHICRSSAVALCAANDVPNYIRDLCQTLPLGELVPGNECDKYYKCNGNSNITAFACPNGEHFSKSHSACKKPLTAGCKTLDNICSDKYDGFRFSSLKCDEYFICNNQLKPESRLCEDGLYFSPNQQKCTEPALSGCSDEGSCENPPVPVCDSSNSGAFFPHKNPHWFYMCYNSKPLEMECQTGLTFDTLRKYCVKDGANRVC